MQKHESGDGVKANYCWLIFLYVWSRRNAGMQHAFTRQTVGPSTFIRCCSIIGSYPNKYEIGILMYSRLLK